LRLSEDVPNFKEDADPKTGVVEPLQGKYIRLGTAPIVVWERTNGDHEVVTGRHRLDLARRSGEKTIPSQIVKESEGWTKEKVAILDAEANIRDNQGKVRDYVNYFQRVKLSEEEASGRGLLSRARGRDGFLIGRYGSDDLHAAFWNEKVSAEKAAAIADIGRGDDGLQRVGLDRVRAMSADELRHFMEALKAFGPPPSERQGNLFGDNDDAVRNAEKISEAVSAIVKEKRDSIARFNKATQREATADWEALSARNKQTQEELARWEHWTTDPQLVQQARERAGLPAAEKGFALQQESAEGRPAAEQAPDYGPETQKTMLPTGDLPGQGELLATEGSEREAGPGSIETRGMLLAPNIWLVWKKLAARFDSPTHDFTAPEAATELARADNASKRFERQLAPTERAFEMMSQADSDAFQDRYERGQEQPTPELQRAAAVLKQGSNVGIGVRAHLVIRQNR